MTRSPTIVDAFTRAIDRRLTDLHVCMPARVERYDGVKGLVDVQPLLKIAAENEQGDRVAEQLPVIPNVPLIYPGSGNFRVTFPVAQGDTVLIVFSENSLDIWLTQGGLVDPLDDRRHALSDAVAIPGLRDFGHPLAEPPTDHLTIGHDSGAQVHIYQGETRIGTDDPGDLEPVAKGDTTKARLDTIQAAFDAHTHVAPGGATGVPNGLIGPLAGVGSSTVKVQK